MGPGLPKPGWLLEGELAARLLLNRVDAVGIERDMVLDRGDRRVGLLVGPDGIDQALATGRNAVIGAVALGGQDKIDQQFITLACVVGYSTYVIFKKIDETNK